MGTMYDSTDPGAIPTSATIVAGYVDGAYVWPASGWALHANATHVTIAIETTTPADVLDVETGNPATPATTVTWATSMRSKGRNPTVYCNRSTWPAMQTAFIAAGVAQPGWWIADWTGHPHDIAGTVAVQYANPDTSGGHYDLSTTVAGWPSVVPTPPAPTPTPQPAKDKFMPPTLTLGTNSGAVKNCQRLLNVHGQGLTVDGAYGTATEHAVRNVQGLFKMTVDGICGPATWTVLDTFG